jgi:hypothetical protein
MSKAWPYEQSREKEEHRHEEAVGGENDRVKAEPRLGIGMTEMSVGNDGMVDDYHQGQEGAGAIQRRVARGGLWHRPNFRGRR